MESTLHTSRREWILSMLLGGGALGLRSIVTGVPVRILKDPLQVFGPKARGVSGRELAQASSRLQYLVLSVSDEGEPMSCNVPGTYEDSKFVHPPGAVMAARPLALGSRLSTAAGIWNTLSSATLGRASFFHHGTASFAHGDLHNVSTLQGVVPQSEFLVSAIAGATQSGLGTIQSQPINISNYSGREIIAAGGAQQPMFSATGIRNLLVPSTLTQGLNKAQALRDRDLMALNTLAKQSGTPSQKDLIELWATTQTQARQIESSIISGLSSISDDTPASQVAVALLLFRMKLCPAVVIHIPFGGDNHSDPGYATEISQHVSGLATLNTLFSGITAELTDKVTFATLSTFGRGNGNDGRTHNGLHSCGLMVGANVKSGVVGGATLSQNADGPAAKALAIDSASGTGGTSGDIPYEMTLAAYGATMAAACGLDKSTTADIVPTGTIVTSAITA